MTDDDKWLALFPASDRVLLLQSNLSAVEVWRRLSPQGKKVIQTRVKDGDRKFQEWRRVHHEWITANYVRLPDGKVERKPRAPKVKPPKPSPFD